MSNTASVYTCSHDPVSPATAAIEPRNRNSPRSNGARRWRRRCRGSPLQRTFPCRQAASLPDLSRQQQIEDARTQRERTCLLDRQRPTSLHSRRCTISVRLRELRESAQASSWKEFPPSRLPPAGTHKLLHRDPSCSARGQSNLATLCRKETYLVPPRVIG